MKILVALLVCAAGFAAQPFHFRELDSGRLALYENGAPVFVYNYGPQLKPGVPENRRRADYLHPVYTPGGVILTDDFPRDHYHHRGIFWSWPVVRVAGSAYDCWTLKGCEQRFERWRGRETNPRFARVTAQNAWYVGGRKVVREEVDLRVYRTRESIREFEVALTLAAVDEPVEIAGSPERGKGYGGFDCRFAPRTGTAIVADTGPVARDEDHVPHAWAEMEALFDGRRAGLRITADVRNPDFPGEWCLRNYGFIGASFPGVKAYRLDRGKPLTLRYRVRVFDISDGPASSPLTRRVP